MNDVGKFGTNVFVLREELTGNYADHVRGFVEVRDERLRGEVDRAIAGGLLCPTPLIGIFLLATVVIVGTLLFLPVIVFGLIVEHLKTREQTVALPATDTADVTPESGATASAQ